MKIAIVNSEHPSSSGNDHGGIATFTYTLARLLAQRGHNIHLLTRSSVSPDRVPSSVTFHKFGFVKSLNPLSRLINRIDRSSAAWEKGHSRSIARIVHEIAQKDGLDIVDIPEYGGLACRYPVGGRPPCVITFHMPSELVDSLNNTPLSKSRRQLYLLEQQGIARAAGYKSPSVALKVHARDAFHLPENSITVIRNPFDFSTLHHWQQSGPPHARFEILFSGRLERRKGAETILQSIKAIMEIGTDITFTFAGETDIANAPNFRQAIERIVSPSYRKRIWFLGPLSPGKLQPLYGNSSLFLFPSLFENCPYALLEAMAAGLPVVATEGSGIGEIVHHGRNGLLFPVNNSEQLVTHVRSLYTNREQARQLGGNAAQSVRHLFDPEELIETTIRFYQSIIDGNGKTR